MPPGLPKHLALADAGDHVILLDLRADRYCRLSGPVSEAARHMAAGIDTSQVLSVLHNAGLLVEELDVRPLRFLTVRATCSALEQSTTDKAAIGPVRVAWALASARARLRTLGLERALAALRTTPKSGRTSDEAEELARGFESDRLSLPFGRKCLPDSLALASLMRSRGIPASLVIGVRDAPFAAHAWVELDDLLLSETLDGIARFIPILRT